MRKIILLLFLITITDINYESLDYETSNLYEVNYGLRSYKYDEKLIEVTEAEKDNYKELDKRIEDKLSEITDLIYSPYVFR